MNPLSRLAASSKLADNPRAIERDENPSVAIIGGGPGSVELSLALRERLGEACEITLLTRAQTLVPDHGRSVQRTSMAALAGANIALFMDFDVVSAAQSDSLGLIVLRNSEGRGIAMPSCI